MIRTAGRGPGYTGTLRFRLPLDTNDQHEREQTFMVAGISPLFAAITSLHFPVSEVIH